MEPFSFPCSASVNHLTTQSSQNIDLSGGCSQVTGESSSKQRRQWSPKEDVLLISAWLNTSKDPIVSNEQKCGTFWKRIQVYFNASALPAGIAPRELIQCKQRWARINELVCKFIGCYDAAMNEQSSGQNENDVIKAALDIFFNDHGIKFSLEHAWRELRHDQKWTTTCLVKEGGKEKRKIVGEAEGSESVPEQRPLGVKACKAAKRKKNPKEEARAKLESMMETKKELNKQRLLDRLLSKKDPLSEIEEALKNKLIEEML